MENANDILSVASGNKPIQLGFDTMEALKLFVILFMAVLLANLVGGLIAK
jgi:hypothetical protein